MQDIKETTKITIINVIHHVWIYFKGHVIIYYNILLLLICYIFRAVILTF